MRAIRLIAGLANLIFDFLMGNFVYVWVCFKCWLLTYRAQSEVEASVPDWVWVVMALFTEMIVCLFVFLC